MLKELRSTILLLPASQQFGLVVLLVVDGLMWVTFAVLILCR